jgi:hypothetical protein
VPFLNADTFLRLIEGLTGTPVKDVTDNDLACLDSVLVDDQRTIDCSQLNELLLLANKDRVSAIFFEKFFGADCRVGTLLTGIQAFQKLALLRYGNFIYAFRTLSRISRTEDLRTELGECARTTAELITSFSSRTPKLLDTILIAKANTPLLGYLSGPEIVAEHGRAQLLQSCLPGAAALPEMTWEAYEARIIEEANPPEHNALRTILASYRAGHAGATVAEFAAHLAAVLPQLAQRDILVQEIRAIATSNQDVYLTWDHMDVYFATSMRKSWEYEDLFDFVQNLMNHASLADLRLRYFDPTQAFTENRVNKGLVESLMLKRARCTVYSVQDTDTLGKDSELAATLAQGKPVIAYVPLIDVDHRVQTLVAETPSTVQERLRFVLYTDDSFAASISPQDYDFVRQFTALEEFEKRRVWRSIPDTAAIEQLKQGHGAAIERLCRIIAHSEARIYDRRAKTLAKSHPLAIQVNLDTGVANGVLVVRTIETCRDLLRRVLTNAMEFDLEENAGDRMWYLRETISGCVYRVVSKDRKLTNCFWNFYRRTST